MYESRVGATHALAARELAVAAVPEDERVWVPQAEGVWFRPLMLNTRFGQWCNLLRVRRGRGNEEAETPDHSSDTKRPHVTNSLDPRVVPALGGTAPPKRVAKT
jgi:hypothetical protein